MATSRHGSEFDTAGKQFGRPNEAILSSFGTNLSAPVRLSRPPRTIHNQFRVIVTKPLDDVTVPADRHVTGQDFRNLFRWDFTPL
jgi:hypothetical protein